MEERQMRQLRQLLEFGEKVFLYDRDFPLVSVDDNFCHMLGFSRQELFIHCRSKASELVYPPDFQEISDDVIHQIETQGEYTCRYRMRRKDGTLIWVQESGVRVKDKEGRDVIHNVVVNISNEEKIRKERDTIYDNVPGGVMMILISDTNFYIVEANHQYFEMMGTSRDEYLGSSGMYTFPEDLPKLRSHIVQKAADREPIDYAFRIHKGEKKQIHWLRMLGRYYEEAEDGCEYLCIMTDISSFKQAEFQLKQEKERYRIAVGLMASSLFEYNLEKQQIRIYSGLSNSDYIPCIEDGVCGTLEEIFRRNEFLFPEDYEKIEKFFQSDESIEEELRLLTRNRKTGKKSYQWFEFEATKVWENNRLSRIIGSVKNLEEKENEELKRRELQDIFVMQSSKIYEMILRINVDTGRMRGFFLEQISFQKIYPDGSFEKYVEVTAEKYIHPNDRERFLHALQLDNMKEILNFSDTEEVLFFRVKSRSGEYRHKCFRYSYMGNNKSVIIVSTQDMHYLREEQLKAEKANQKILLDTLNEAKSTTEMRRNFSAMIAREIRAPLKFIQTRLKNGDGVTENTEEMQAAVSCMMGILDNIAEYERFERGQILFDNKQFSLEDALTDVFRVWKRRGEASGIRVICSLNLKWKSYYGDVLRVGQIVSNILGNCIKSSVKGSEICIWGTDSDEGGGISRLSLVFEDTGIPVDESFFGRVYPMDPGDGEVVWDNATKQMGTEYSLIIARKIVEAMGGRMRLNRRNDTSNLLEVEIPLQRLQELTENKTVALSETEPGAEVDLSQYSLLLVKENDSDNNLTGPILKLNGASVDMANSGMEGVNLWASYPEGYFDAILVESTLADMDYLEFTEMFRMQKAKGAGEVLIIALVDNVNQENIKAGMQLGINAVLGKPLNLKRLKHILDVICQ